MRPYRREEHRSSCRYGLQSLFRFQTPERFGEFANAPLHVRVQYSPADSTITVSLSVADQVFVSVHNGGEPIPPDQLKSIFKPLSRGTDSGATPPSANLGLGLFTHKIITAHGGNLAVVLAPVIVESLPLPQQHAVGLESARQTIRFDCAGGNARFAGTTVGVTAIGLVLTSGSITSKVGEIINHHSWNRRRPIRFGDFCKSAG
jgi:hypothetical protein